MHYEITHLDRRYSYRDQFPYMIEFHKGRSWNQGPVGTGVLDFDASRKWFNENFGWSQDIETRSEMIRAITTNHDHDSLKTLNIDWAYSIRYQEYRIYVSDRALTMFNLKWATHS